LIRTLTGKGGLALKEFVAVDITSGTLIKASFVALLSALWYML
jgi:hypothetical protein